MESAVVERLYTGVPDNAGSIPVGRAMKHLLFKLMFGLRSRDLNATPKVFTREFMEASRLRSKDWFIDAEMVIKAERMGLAVGEMEIEYLPRLKGKSTVRLRHIFEFLRNMVWWRERARHGNLLEE